MSANCYRDSEYLMYGIGLLTEHHPAKALRIAKKYLQPVQLKKNMAAFAFAAA